MGVLVAAVFDVLRSNYVTIRIGCRISFTVIVLLASSRTLVLGMCPAENY